VSGQLVGEVIAAVPELDARGISRAGFMALVGIAEKCHDPEDRQASVPLSWIQNSLYGASESTARRAIKELVGADLLEVVKPGFRNRFGWRAPVYRILASATAMTTATELADTTAMTTATGVALVKTGCSSGHSGCSSVIDPPATSNNAALTVTTNGTINGSTNDTRRAEKGHPLPDGWEPPAAVMTQLRERWPRIDLVDALEEFRDFWCAVPGARGRKTDWSATFRNRVRDLEKRRQREEGRTRPGGTRLSTADQRVRDIQALKTTHLELDA